MTHKNRTEQMLGSRSKRNDAIVAYARFDVTREGERRKEVISSIISKTL
jgi:hypothetical protein